MNPLRSRLAIALALPTFLVLAGCAPDVARAQQCPHHGGHAGPSNRASFQVEAVREIANDWATARLRVQAEGKRAADVAGEVNTAMTAALGRARKARDVEVSSGSYTTHPVYDDGRVVRWRASQDLRLEAADTDALSRLIGDLQNASVQLVGIQFGVRRETREKVEEELISEALGLFRKRAALIAEGLGTKDWRLVDVSVGASHPGVVQVRREQARSFDMMSSAPAPAFEAGTSEVRVHASGTVAIE